MTDLPIPDAAVRALVAATEPKTDDGPVPTVRAIAAPVVAAELRRFAERYEQYAQDSGGSMHYTYGGVASQLADRADALDGEGVRRFVRSMHGEEAP